MHDWPLPIPPELAEAERLEQTGRLAEAAAVLRAFVADRPVSEIRLQLARVLAYAGSAERAEAGPILESLIEEGDPAILGCARALQAFVAWHEGDVEAAGELASAILDHAGPAPNRERAAALHVLGMVRFVSGEADRGIIDLQDAAQQFRELEDAVQHGRVLDSIGNLLTRRGRVAEAAPYLEQSLKLKRELGDKQGEAITLGNLGRVKMAQGDLAAASECFLEDLAISRVLGDTRGIGISLNHLGEVALARGDLEGAAAHYDESLASVPEATNRAYATLGLARTQRHDLDASRAHCDEVQILLETEDLPDKDTLRAWREFVEAEALAAAGHTHGAVTLLESAAVVLRRRGVGPRLLDVLLQLSRLYAQEERSADALAAAQEIFALLDHYGAQERVREVEQWLSAFDRQALLTMVLRRYLPPEYVTALLGAQADGGQSLRRQVTVLFSDIRDFTPFSEETPPEEVTLTLNAWLRRATEAVALHGGVIDKFLGDGVMALFGAFAEDEQADDPARAPRGAVEAGLALLDAMADYNETRSLTGRSTFRIGVGIATGEAVVGNVGSAARMDFTAIGRPVNLASRLEAATKQVDWPLVVCARTRALLGQDVETDSRAHVAIKGIGDDVTVHLVKQIGDRGVRRP